MVVNGIENVIVLKSKDFAVRTVNAYKFLCIKKGEYILSKQLLRSGTSIGANVKEAMRGQSKKDFYAKLNIALKEAVETDYIDKKLFDSINSDCQEVIKLLVSITKTQKNNSEL